MAQIWKAYRAFNDLKDTGNKNDQLIEGYCVPLDGQEFRIFVLNELTGTKRGFILKIMFQLGTDYFTDIRDRILFPQTNSIFRDARYGRGDWKNKAKKDGRHCYKYIVYGHDEKNKEAALRMMYQIIIHIAEMAYNNN
jgi:type IV secretory pathway TraG/TraD family ATPase VirD4